MVSNIEKSAGKTYFWNDEKTRGIIYQVVTALLVAFIGYYLISNVQNNMAKQSIASGFDFLEKEAAFEIGETLIEYSAADNYGRALVVGVLNTLKVSLKTLCLSGELPHEGEVILTRERHRDGLLNTQKHLLSAREALTQKMSQEFIVLDLRGALDALGDIVGATTADDILNQIFSEFCIGK